MSLRATNPRFGARVASARATLARRRARPGRVDVVPSAGPKNRLREKEAKKRSSSARDYEREMDDYVEKHVAPATRALDAARARPERRSDAQRFIRKVQRKVKKASQKAVDALLPRDAGAFRPRADVPARVGAPGTYATVYRPQRPNPASAYGRAAAAWGTLFACAWIALKVINRENPLRAIGSAFKGVGRRAPPPGATGPGRWVGDRSLGGRQVWVPATADRFRDERKRLEGALDDVPEDANVKPGSATKARGNEKKTSGAAKALPAWWTPPSPQYVPPGRKEALIQVAKAQGATLAAKRVSGAGFSADDIADFRAACAAAGERGCAVKSVGPESARVAIFRAAADFAVTDAMRGQAGATSAFNTPVGPFLVGLSDDLSLDAHKCVSIVMADVAVRVRGAVVQAGAGLRSNDSVATMLELNKLVDLFNTFPFTPDAPELDMLSVGLRSRLSEDERRRICDEFDAISNGEHSAVVRVAVCGASDSAYE